MTDKSPTEIIQKFNELFPDGEAGEWSPDLDFLEEFGHSYTVLLSAWVKQVGPQAFAKIVMGLCSAGSEGRPQSDYSSLIEDYRRIERHFPGVGKYEIAARVVSDAWNSAGKWPAGRRPATKKAATETLVQKTNSKNSKKPLTPAETKQERELKSRVERRVNALHARSEKTIGRAELLAEAAPFLRLMFSGRDAGDP